MQKILRLRAATARMLLPSLGLLRLLLLLLRLRTVLVAARPWLRLRLWLRRLQRPAL